MYIIIAFLIVALDQITKIVVNSNIGYSYEIEVIKDFFYLTNIRNKGVAFGMLQDARIVFIPLTIFIMVFLTYLLMREEKWYKKLVYSLILGGAVGNFIDRIFRGYVIDFLDFYIFSYNFPTFNVADIFITIGTILLLFLVLKEEEFFRIEHWRRKERNGEF